MNNEKRFNSHTTGEINKGHFLNKIQFTKKGISSKVLKDNEKSLKNTTLKNHSKFNQKSTLLKYI